MPAEKSQDETKRRRMVLRLLGGKLQKRLSTAAAVPEDVKEGQFVVVAVEGERSQRFVVDLGCLNSPAFLKLLEEAKEEFGFEQKGALAVPCRPEELQRILEDKCRGGRRWFRRKNASMIESY